VDGRDPKNFLYGRWALMKSTRIIGSTFLAAAIATAACGTEQCGLWPRRVEDPLARLVLAYPHGRPFEGRLSAAIPFRPFLEPPGVRGDASGQALWSQTEHGDFGDVEYLRALAGVYEASASDASPRVRGDAAIAKLYEGKPRLAVAFLTRAVRDAPEDASLESDLSVAYLALARTESRREFALDALEAADEAVARDPSNQAALFNRALAAQEVGLTGTAREAWIAYLSQNPDSPYAQEACTRLAGFNASPAMRWSEINSKLEEAASAGDLAELRDLVEHHPDVAHVYARDSAFGRWADLVLANSPRAGDALRACRNLAAVIEERLSDATYLSAVNVIERAGHDSLALAEAHRAFRDGRRLFEEQKGAAARIQFAHARALFAACHATAFEVYALSYVASCDYLGFHYGRVLRGLEPAREVAERQGYRGILGRIAWIRGSTLMRQGDLVHSSEAYREAISLYDSVHDWDASAAVRGFLAEDAAQLADPVQFRREAARLFDDSSRLASESRRYRVLSEIALALAQESTSRVALDFTNECFSEAVESEDAELRIDASLQRGVLRAELGDVAGARADLSDAESRFEGLSDDLRELLRARLLVATGAISLEQGDASALASLDEACTLVDRVDLRASLGISAHVLRARAREAAGDVDAAEDDLNTAIAISRRNAKVLGASYVPSAFDRPHSAFDAMLVLQVERRGSPERALAYAEAARAPALLAALTSGAGTEFDLAELRGRLSPGTALVEYSVLDDRMYAWTVSAAGFSFSTIPIGRVALRDEIRALNAAATAGSQTSDEAARGYDLLIRPVVRELGGIRHLIIVASEPLADVPFSMLYDETRGRYLVEDYSVTSAPSANAYLACLERDEALGARAPESALVVGDPAFEPATFAGLRRLPAAADEARRVAVIYGTRGDLLLGAEATETRVLERAHSYQVLHFATHGISDAGAPSLSALVLAPDPTATQDRQDGRLCAYELARLRLPNTRIVVLASCRSGEVAGPEDDAVSPLVRALLVAGVSAVVATLWNVDDAAAEEFSSSFHSALRSGVAPAEAVRCAQLALLRNADPRFRSPALWAAFGLVGGTVI
jgi:CHAT domain-containing protein/Tfp pilus assembly protein PilF